RTAADAAVATSACPCAPFFRSLSEEELQTQLNQPRICSGINAADDAERRAAYRRVRRSELSAIEEVEEFGAEFEAKAFVGAEAGSLECGYVEILDAVGTQRRINAGFVAENEVRRGYETRRIEPLAKLGRAAGRRGLVASRHDVGARTAPKAGGEVG